MISFLYPKMILLLVLPFIIRRILPPMKGRFTEALRVPFIADFITIEQNQKNTTSLISSDNRFGKNFWVFFTVWILLIVAAMRPVEIGNPMRIQNQGRDIILVSDISESMLEKDFSYQSYRLDRLTAVKKVVSDFVAQRQSDRIGLVLFGTRAYLQAPLTYDRHTVQEVLWSMDAGMAGDSTSIGDALGLALKTFKENSDNLQNKVIILLTDGENNDGSLTLPEAVNLAKQEGVKIYTVGVGHGRGTLISSFFGIANAPFDEKTLKQLAHETEGRYFHASDLSGLTKIYHEIDELEPENADSNFIYPKKELFYIPLLAAWLLAFLWGYGLRRLGL